MAEQLEPKLDVDEIQGNIIPGFNKDHVLLIGLTINNVDKAKKWISNIVDNISTCNEVYNFNKTRSLIKTRTKKEPYNVLSTWTNISFSYNGLMQFLGDQFIEIDKFLEQSFKDGLILRSPDLGDPLEEDHEGHPKQWEIGAKDVPLGQRRCMPDILLVIASDESNKLIQEYNKINNESDLNGLILCYDEEGHDLSHYGYEELRGHEHFGFKDGISQPGIRGKISEKENDFFTPRLKDNDSSNENSVEYGIHGKPLIAPGEFILGYPVQSPNRPRKVLPPQPTHPLLKNGSYLVYRRLKQDVNAFNTFITNETKRLSLVIDNISEQKLKALLVGRWPSGAPISITHEQDDPKLGSDPDLNNKFGYVNDDDGLKTPIISHIRKVNPRDLSTDIGNSNLTLKKRILRRGIPFGSPLNNHHDNTKDRGLMFLCYQDSIKDKFEFLTRKWMGKSNAPTNASSTSPDANSSGYDLLVGSINANTTKEDKELFGFLNFNKDDSYIQYKIETKGFGIHHWITPTGGGYFFTPSITMLNNIGK